MQIVKQADPVDVANLAPSEIPERDLRSLVSGIYHTLKPGERTYLKLRVDLMHSRKEARELTQLSMAEVKVLEAKAVPHAIELKMRRPNIERDEVIDTVRDAILMAKDASNPMAVLKGAQLLSELGGVSRPADELENLHQGTAGDTSADVLRKLSAGEIDISTCQRLLHGLNQAATTQLQEEERQRLQQDANANPHNAGTVPWQNHEQDKRAHANMVKFLREENERRQGLIDITPEGSE